MERVALRVRALREGDDAAKTAARLVGTGGGLVGLGAEGVLGAVAAEVRTPRAARTSSLNGRHAAVSASAVMFASKR